jgi:trehalose 6-phosphate phosphatase
MKAAASARSAQAHYQALVSAPGSVLVGLDFDGVLAPIVPDPSRAVIHPDGPRVLTELIPLVRAVAVITGRPARQAVELGGLEMLADRLLDGGELFVLGQYGNERWDAGTRTFLEPSPPHGLANLLRDLPGLLLEAGVEDAHVEDKGIAVAVHTRRLPDPRAAFDRLVGPLTAAATRHGLTVEPGRSVVEVRGPGMDKGEALRLVRREVGADGVLFAGDDLGDIEAFQAVKALREQGSPGFLVCSGSREQQALVDLADVVVDGPDGVMRLLDQFTLDARASRA